MYFYTQLRGEFIGGFLLNLSVITFDREVRSGCSTHAALAYAFINGSNGSDLIGFPYAKLKIPLKI
jgi:hypothetical protein